MIEKKPRSLAEALTVLCSEEGIQMLLAEIEKEEKRPKTSEELERDSRLFHLLLMDDAADDTEIRELCKEILPAEIVDGDSFWVPSQVELVRMLVEEIKKLRSKS